MNRNDHNDGQFRDSHGQPGDGAHHPGYNGTPDANPTGPHMHSEPHPGPQGYHPEERGRGGRWEGKTWIPTPPRRKRRFLPWITGGAIAVLFAGCLATNGGSEQSQPASNDTTVEEPQTVGPDPRVEETTAPEADGHVVTITATSSTGGTALWSDGDGGTFDQPLTPGVPWTTTIEDVESWSWIDVSVTGDFMQDGGTVSCEITVDGETIDQATGQGAAGSAYCTSF